MKVWLKKHKSQIELTIFMMFYWLGIPLLVSCCLGYKYSDINIEDYEFVLDLVLILYMLLGMTIQWFADEIDNVRKTLADKNSI